MKLDRRTFLRNSALAGGAAALESLSSKAHAATGTGILPPGQAPDATSSAIVRKLFQSPPKKYRPIARWWWPGNDVTEVELRREIGVLDQAGFGGAEIQAFVKGFATQGMPPEQLRRVNGFATPSFFQHVAVAIDEARSHGMFIDYTFGSGWPFGGGLDITPELASIELRSTHLSISGPAKFRERLQVPSLDDGDPLNGANALKGLPDGWPDRMRKRTRLVGVVAVRGTDAQWDRNLGGGRDRTAAISGALEPGTSINLTAHLEPDGTLTWDVPPGTWQLFVFCSLPTGQHVNAGAGDGPQLVMDHLSSAAFAAHAQRVGGNAIPYIGKYFGNGLRAIFCDSLEVSANLFWSDDFLAEFQQRRGYDLTPYLPILKVHSIFEPYGEFVDLPLFEMPGAGQQVRHDYHLTVSDLMIERFYGQFNKWAHDHHLLSRTQAHGAPADVLRIYGEADIPETEDLFAQGGYDFLKMAASAAHVEGRAIVGSESFVWTNAAYETTPEKVKLAADELLTAGVNAIVYHGFPYIMPGVPAPGWHPFTGRFGEGNYSSQFNELNPLWPYFAPLNGYITRLQYLSQVGTNVSAVALFRNDLAHGADEAPPAPRLNQALMDAGYNYDHINADSLLHCTVRDKLLVTRGGAQYRALVLPAPNTIPAVDAIDDDVAGKLVEFANAGLPIFFAKQIPTGAEGLMENAQATQRALTALHAFPNVSVAADIADLIAKLPQTVSSNVRFLGPSVPFIQKRIGNFNAYFLRNETDAVLHLHAEFEAEGTPELWDPWSGEIAGIASTQRKGSWVAVELDLEPFSSALIVFDPEGSETAAVAQKARRLLRTEAIGSNGWKLSAAGLVPSGATSEFHRDLPALVDWSLDSELRGFSGRGVYTASFTAPGADAGSSVILDLGNVRDVAEVTVNGKHVATLLLRPYRADITDFVHPGENTLEIAVTNTLYNSMTLRNPRAFRPGPTENPSGLMSGGLMGPVQLKVME